MMNNKTILFVDNDPVSQTKYQKGLEGEGFHLECAQDGQVALDILSERSPDLVLLDPMLPKVSGADVLKFMNADPRLTTVPVIIFSNTPMTEVPPDSPLAWGAKRLLKSDCTFPKLLETIQETLVAPPEFVVVETEKIPSSQPSVASNGEDKRNGTDAVATPDSEIMATKGRAEFLNEALAIMPKICEHSMGYIKAPSLKAGQDHLSELRQRVQLLNTGAAQADCARVALLTNALDGLLSGILDKPSTATQSVPQTVAQAVDCLDGLLKNNDGYSVGPPFQAKVLVVDDDTVCNHVNVTSLKRASFDAVGVKDPGAALNLMETSPFDLVLLDVNMPGLTGFDVCEKLRRLPNCRKTPVIFVTAFSSFDNRKQSVLSGGNDFVSKPIFPLELALKVSINLIKARVEGTRTSQTKTNSAATNDSQNVFQPTTSTRINQLVNAQEQPPESLSSWMPTGEPNIENARTADPPVETRQPGIEPLPTNSIPQLVIQPNTLAPNGQQKNGETWTAEIHERLRQSTAELEQAKSGLEQESAERARVESQWREQLSAARALVEQTETVLKEKEARCSRLETRCDELEKELTGLQQERDELQKKLKTEQQAVGKSQQEIKELHERLSQSNAELQRAKVGLEQQTVERMRLESEWREQLNASKAAADKTEAALKEKETRYGELERELAGLHQLRDELQNKSAAEQQATAKSQQTVKELQERLHLGNAELEQAKAGLEQQTAERMRLESEWREQLNTSKAAADKTETALKEKETRCGELERELAGLLQLRDELQNKFATEQQASAKLQLEIKELQEHLRQGGAELEHAKARLEQESAKQVRLESEYQSLAEAKEAQNLELGSLRERQAEREAELRDKQKKLAEGLRESIQLLQLRLQEAETFNGDLASASNGEPNAR